MVSATLNKPRIAEHDDETAVHETNGHGEPEATKAVESEAAAKDPIPPPSPAELRAAHYAEIVAESVNVEEARHDFEESAADTKRLKKEYEGRQALFLRLTRRDPLQRTLIAEPHSEFDNLEPLPVDTEWRKLPVSTLDVADHIVGKLDNHGITTLGDLQDHWKAGKKLRDFKGIGEAADTAVVDAFSEYGAQHPEVFGEKPAPVESEDEPEDEDGEE